MNNLVGLSELRRVYHQTPRHTNTHTHTRKHFVTAPVGLIKFKQVIKKTSCHPNCVLQPTQGILKKNTEEEANEEKKLPAHVTIP